MALLGGVNSEMSRDDRFLFAHRFEVFEMRIGLKRIEQTETLTSLRCMSLSQFDTGNGSVEGRIETFDKTMISIVYGQVEKSKIGKFELLDDGSERFEEIPSEGGFILHDSESYDFFEAIGVGIRSDREKRVYRLEHGRQPSKRRD